jgi:hypothetical protein
MRALILSIVLAVPFLIQAGCSAGVHAGRRDAGVGAGAAVGTVPVYVDPQAPLPPPK